MAVIPAVYSVRARPTLNGLIGTGVIHVFTWSTVTEADTCAAIEINGKVAEANIQMGGTWGGGVMSVYGSVSGTLFTALLDGTGTAIAVSANGFVPGGLAQIPPQLQPTATTAGTGRDIDIEIALRMLGG